MKAVGKYFVASPNLFRRHIKLVCCFDNSRFEDNVSGIERLFTVERWRKQAIVDLR
jgi:hypothetical protein